MNSISPFGVATSMLINGWSEYDAENVDILEEDAEQRKQKMEEMVRSLANLKGPTLRAKDIAEATLHLGESEAYLYCTGTPANAPRRRMHRHSNKCSKMANAPGNAPILQRVLQDLTMNAQDGECSRECSNAPRNSPMLQ